MTRRPSVIPMLLAAVPVLLTAGCPTSPSESNTPQPPRHSMEPLALQQLKAYPETVTRRFVSLVDFEDAPIGPRGHSQADWFSFAPPDPNALARFDVNVSRTGAGALDVLLPPRTRLLLRPPVHDFSNYSLLALAVHTSSLRDDLRIELTSERASWRSPRTLLQPGWTHVLIDIRRLKDTPGFDVRRVRGLALLFEESADAVRFHLDDVLLIDNARDLAPVPPGFTLHKEGLDYALSLPNPARRIAVRQGDDALWRDGALRPSIAVAAPGRPLAATGESLERMGDRRIGNFQVLEHNPARVRLRNTWFFPSRGGDWLSQSVRRLVIEHTLWADGRTVTAIELNNAGGPEIGALRLRAPAPAAWTAHGRRTELLLSPFHGPVGLWQYLLPPAIPVPSAVEGPSAGVLESNYLAPPPLQITLGAKDSRAPGDADRDGFDESQGCYFLAAAPGGHCRFTVRPPPEGLLNPAFHVYGPWGPDVSVQTAGRSIRDIGHVGDGSIVFLLPGLHRDEFPLEITGPLMEPPAP